MNSTLRTEKNLGRAAAVLLLVLACLIIPGKARAAGATGRYTLEVTTPDLRGQEFLVLALNDAVASSSSEQELDDLDDSFLDDDIGTSIADPIEPFNRAMFVFNDKLYFWVLKPTAGFYGRTVPEKGRVAVRRFFRNVATPIRLVNALLQFKFKHAGTELARFGINTTVGLLGFKDPARDRWDIYMHKEDFGQSIGHYGAGPGFYITWPILGPSSLRDTFGLIGDFFLDPATYIFAEERLLGFGVWSYDKVNSTSLELTLYEDLTKSALDPYIFIRDAYHQHREELIRE